jgi:excisionase family DNA binding protein
MRPSDHRTLAMPVPLASITSGPPCEVQSGRRSGRISTQEIAERLDIGRLAVYAMLEQEILPGIRLGRRWIITRHAYEQWERTCGIRAGAGLER